MSYCIIGESELVLGFSLVGIKGIEVHSHSEALQAFLQATGQGSGAYEPMKVLIITEPVAHMLEEEVNTWQMSGSYPLIVEIPSLQGPVEGKKSLTDAIREAIGVHV